MAFFVGPSLPTLPLGFRGPFLGLFDNPLEHPSSTSPSTVGVEFDTYWNRVWDPQDIAGHDHVGIDVNSIRSTSYTRGLAKGDLSGTMSANITYDGGSKLMVVTLRLANGSTSQIQALVDFRDAGVPQDAAIGFSAATWADVNQLLSWSFSSTVLSAASALLAGLVVAMTCFIMMRRKRPPPPMEIELPVARKFSYGELSTAIKNFSKDRKLGEGSFGEVYRGELRDPRMPPVAVKRLTKLMEYTWRDYVTEIMTLGQLSHRNLVNLVGWCDGGGSDKLLLVYELVSNKSLDEHLHGSESLLTWPERYKIVLGIGSAIEYLHTGYQNPILHRDIKPSNVMLDDAFEAKLGDFGLVRQVKPGQGSLNDTVMVGSWDYMDPTCAFGVLLLEIATGKRPRVQRDDEELGLPNVLLNAVRESYGKGAVLEMADARLGGDYDENRMERVMLVGLLCVHRDRRKKLSICSRISSTRYLNLKLSLPEHSHPSRACWRLSII
uniref:non-specific serine/threonine protein kinase n=1 Tax=Setaria italica TaxID=4555 RepID=K3XQD6_SETIT